jgi:hypothetical protein
MAILLRFQTRSVVGKTDTTYHHSAAKAVIRQRGWLVRYGPWRPLMESGHHAAANWRFTVTRLQCVAAGADKEARSRARRERQR